MDQSDKRGPTLPHLLGGGRAKVEFRVGLTPGLSVNGVRAGAPLSYLITSVAKVRVVCHSLHATDVRR